MHRGSFALAALLVAGCGASSSYDRAWVAREMTSRTGYGLGDPTRGPSLPPKLKSIAALTEDDAVRVALWNSVAFEVELAQLGYARADLEDAGALPNPTLSFLFPMGPRQLEFSLLYPLAALVHRPSRVAAGKLEVERTARALVQTGLDLMRDTRVAYAELVLAHDRKLLRKTMAETWRKIATIAKVRVSTGDVAAIEAATAEADAVIADDASRRADADLDVARARLRFLLGLGDSPLGDGLGVVAGPADVTEPAAEATLIKTAHAARPDLRAAELAVESAGDKLGWEKARIFQFMGRLDGKPIGSKGGAPVLLLPGFQAEIPLFNWNAAGRDRAHVDIERATSRYLLLKQTLATEIRVARANLAQALGSLAAYRDKVVPLLEKAVASALRNYEEGNEPYVFVLEAGRRLQDAKLRVLDLELDVRRARATLDRNIGSRTDAH